MVGEFNCCAKEGFMMRDTGHGTGQRTLEKDIRPMTYDIRPMTYDLGRTSYDLEHTI